MGKAAALMKFFFLLLIVLAAQETVVQKAEANTCQALSDKYQGACLFNSSCNNVCKNKEHLLSGTCKNFQCYCTRNC